MADGQSDLVSFRAEARAWLAENFPKSLARDAGPTLDASEAAATADDEVWRRRLADKGWGVPHWPRQYGGGGLNGAQTAALREEMARIGAVNPIGGMGVMMFGPTLLEYGTEEQKQRHLPPITRGELRWCQGFSEPGAGSDLAGLQTKAEDKGDHFLVNGSKIWTSGAQYAHWCFCLVRTDPTKKHEGISFLLIDMKGGGVDPRPIRLINDTAPFCETFFTDVKVPKENLVGPLNGGWSIAKRLLQHERTGLAAGGAASGGADGRAVIPELAKKYVGVDERGRIADHDLRARIIDFEMTRHAFQQTARRSAAESRHANGPSAASSIMKNVGSFIRRDSAELTVEIMGNRGIGWGGAGFTEEETLAPRVMLRSKSGTIAGGSQEVQWNIISKRILGLPDAAGSSKQ